jgi:hypothetical protein
VARNVLSRMLGEVKRLTPDEQRQLRAALDQLLSPPAVPPTEEQFERELVEEGILDQVPLPPSAREPTGKRKPIDIKGKPLSENILEDRR